MMKVLVLLGLFSGAAATAQAECALDGAKAVSQLSDVVVFLWAATERCGPAPDGNSLSPKCAIDITSAIKSATDMVMVIASAAEDCAAVKAESYGCGMAVGRLTDSAAAIASGSAGIVEHCAKHAESADPHLGSQTTVGKCFTDAKGAVADLFKATLKMSQASAACAPGSAECARNALNIIGFLSDMGAALGHAYDHCGQVEGHAASADAACTAAVLEGVGGLHNLAEAGVHMSHACNVDQPRAVAIERKYQAERIQARASAFTPNLMMAAFLPIFAVLGFFAGSKFAKGRTAQGRDAEMLSMIDNEEQ